MQPAFKNGVIPPIDEKLLSVPPRQTTVRDAYAAMINEVLVRFAQSESHQQKILEFYASNPELRGKRLIRIIEQYLSKIARAHVCITGSKICLTLSEGTGIGDPISWNFEPRGLHEWLEGIANYFKEHLNGNCPV